MSWSTQYEFLVEEVHAAYCSQTCRSCGYMAKNNRPNASSGGIGVSPRSMRGSNTFCRHRAGRHQTDSHHRPSPVRIPGHRGHPLRLIVGTFVDFPESVPTMAESLPTIAGMRN